MKWILIVLGGLVVLGLLLWLVGALLPRAHRATCRATFRAAPEVLFALLTDVDAFPSWRPEVTSVRRVEPIGGKPAFVEVSSHGSIRYALEANDPPRRLVTRIADDSLAFGGTWTFELTPNGTGTTLATTEDGIVKPALFRALSRFVFGHHATLERYLANLAKKLGETVKIERAG